MLKLLGQQKLHRRTMFAFI